MQDNTISERVSRQFVTPKTSNETCIKDQLHIIKTVILFAAPRYNFIVKNRALGQPDRVMMALGTADKISVTR